MQPAGKQPGSQQGKGSMNKPLNLNGLYDMPESLVSYGIDCMGNIEN